MIEHARTSGWRRRIAPVLEALECRQLLAAFYTGPSINRPVSSNGGRFLIQVSGPGVVKAHPAGRSGIDLSAFGTTAASTINITQIRPRWHFPSQLLVLHNVRITSGQLGALNAAAAELNGSMTRINNGVNLLALGEIGPNADIDINGNLGTLSVAAINLGPSGKVVIAERSDTDSLTTAMTVGSFDIDGGRIVIGQDSLAPIVVTGDMKISGDGLFSVGRDLDGSLTVNGNLELDSGGQLFVGRNVDGLTVDGNLIVNPGGSGIVVNGMLDNLSVTGFFQGQGGTAAPTIFDLGVGLNLTGLTISGADLNLNSLINANIRAGGSISDVNIAYGTVNSTIQPNTPPLT